MDRLRQKGYLTRKKQDGIFQYTSAVAQETLLTGLVQRFVEKTLAGSLTPLIAYFARAKELSPDERAQLESLIARFEDEKTPKSKEPGQ
jgi:predicted transcriptional regulator